MDKNLIQTAVFESLLYMDGVKYSIGEGFYVQFINTNEWGDENIEKYAIRVLYREYPFIEDEDEEFKVYCLDKYSGGLRGTLILFGNQIVDSIVRDIMKDCFYHVETILDELPF